MRKLVVLVLMAFWAAPAAAQEFPELTGRVVDEANILSPAVERELTAKLAAWEEKSSDQLVVVTLPSLQGYEIEDFGYRLGRAWGIGVDDSGDGRALDNGALLIVAPNERSVRIEVGYGLEPVLTDAASRIIIERGIIPLFREGDLEAGVVRGVEGMVATLSGDEAEWMDRRERAGGRPVAEGEGSFPWPLLIFIALMLLQFTLRGRNRIHRARRRGSRSGNAEIIAGMILSDMLSSSGRRGGWSGGSSGGFGGGGFSGGGGSFGGGGASGSW